MQFDDSFLQEMGLQAMPEDQKKAFLDYVQEELEVRIGERWDFRLCRKERNKIFWIMFKKS